MVSGRKVFLGHFIYPQDRGKLSYLIDAGVCVDENGKIAAVAEDRAKLESDILPLLGWSMEEVDVRKTSGDDEFFFPGFVGKPLSLPPPVSTTNRRGKTPTSTPRSTPTRVSSASPPCSTG